MSRETIENTLNSTAFLHQILLIIMLLAKLLKRREIYVYIYIYIYISYILKQWPRDLKTDFTLGICLFGSV